MYNIIMHALLVCIKT